MNWNDDRKLTKSLIEEIEWVSSVLKRMGTGFDKRLTQEFLGRTVEFIKGVLYERERQEREKQREDEVKKWTKNYFTPP